MDDFPLFMLCLLGLIGASMIVLVTPHDSIHPLGINVTRYDNGSCRYTWLGGVDYQSFVRDIAVDDVSIGHPEPGTVIHVGDCNSTVKMYFIDVKSYRELWPNAEATGSNS